MKNKILVMAVLCMLFTTIFENKELAVYAAARSEIYSYDTSTYSISSNDTNTGEVIDSILLDDKTVSRIKSGYGLIIYGDCLSGGSEYVYVYTMPLKYIFSTGSYTVDGYSTTKKGWKALTFDFTEIPTAELDIYVVKSFVDSNHEFRNFQEVLPTSSGDNSVFTDGRYCIGAMTDNSLHTFLVFSTINIYSNDGEGVFNLLHQGIYTPDAWSTEANLNFVASSNETETLYPFEYNPDYYYVIRKNRFSTADHIWHLAQIRTFEDSTFHLYYTEKALADDYIGLADPICAEMQSIVVQEYIYDESGGGWLYVERNGYSVYGEEVAEEILVLNDEFRLAYTNVPIYTDINKTKLYQGVTSGFIDIPTVEVTPDKNEDEYIEIAITAELGKFYAKPDINSDYICGMSQGTVIKVGASVTGADGQLWFKAQYENRSGTYEGYIQASDIISGGSSSEGGDSGSSEIYANAIITGGIAILLEEPSLSSSTVDYIPSGTAVVVIGSVVENDSGEKYYYTRYIEEATEKYGYVPAQYISFDFSGSGSGSGSIGGSSSDNILGDTGIFDVDSEDFKDSLTNAGESLEGILGFITKIPVVIGQIFSFLPDWCLTIVGLSFTLSALLLIYKLIRG